MTSLWPGSAEYQAVVGDDDASKPFESTAPGYAEMVNAFLDPTVAAAMTADVLRSNYTTDLRASMQRVVYNLVVNLGDNAPVNVPREMLTGIRQVINSLPIPLSLSDTGVMNNFPASGLSPQGAVNVAIGVGLTALGVQVPVVGTIAAAIIGIAIGLRKRIEKFREKRELAAADRRAAFYESLPPLQVGGGKELDNIMINQVIGPALRTRDLTKLFLPRFDSTKPWVGLERDGGMAFGQGTKYPGEDPSRLGGEWDVIEPSPDGGLGCIPGTNRITGLIQVSLNTNEASPEGALWKGFRLGAGKGGKDPRNLDRAQGGLAGWERVQDTGLWMRTSGTVAGNLWDLARRRGNPLKYRLDPLKMHNQWRGWAERGLEFIRNVCYPWWSKYSLPEGGIDPDANLEGYLGTGTFLAFGAWASQVNPQGSSTYHQNFWDFPRPFGYTGDQMAASWAPCYGSRHSTVWSERSGAFLPIYSPANWHDAGMGENYNRGLNIRGTLNNLQAQQYRELVDTIVCASVSIEDAAFKADPALREKMLASRAILLKHKARFDVDLDDVLDSEPGVPGLPGQAEGWKAQLVKAGVKPIPPGLQGQGGVKLGSEPEYKPPNYCEAGMVCNDPDAVPEFQPMPANPFDKPKPPKRHGRPSSGGGGAGVAVGGALLFGLAAMFLRGRG